MSKLLNTFVFPIVRREYILDALQSLRYFTPPNYQTIVVDQTQPDAEFEERLRGLCDVHVKTKKNFGFAQATNMGWRLALGQREWVRVSNRNVITEDDCILGGHTKLGENALYVKQIYEKCDVWMRPHMFWLQPTEYLTTCNCDVVFIWQYWWHGIMETFKRYDTAVCVNPMSPREPGWGYGEPGYREHLTFKESTNPDNILKLIEEKSNQVVDGITTWCTVFKASGLEEIGMYDERFWPGEGEDYDLCARAYLAGYRMLATSLSWVWHWWGQSKDESDGLSQALPPAREHWNKLNILWPDGFDVWAKDPETQEPLTRIPEVAIMPL